MTRKSPRESPVFFVDRALGRIVIPQALKAAGFSVERHDDHFHQSVPDAEWLPRVGKKGWVILTKDKHIDKNQIELRALYNAGAASFVLSGGNMTGQQMSKSLLTAMPTMLRFLEKFDRPFVARVTPAGAVKMHLTASGLIKKL